MVEINWSHFVSIFWHCCQKCYGCIQCPNLACYLSVIWLALPPVQAGSGIDSMLKFTNFAKNQASRGKLGSFHGHFYAEYNCTSIVAVHISVISVDWGNLLSTAIIVKTWQIMPWFHQYFLQYHLMSGKCAWYICGCHKLPKEKCLCSRAWKFPRWAYNLGHAVGKKYWINTEKSWLYHCMADLRIGLSEFLFLRLHQLCSLCTAQAYWKHLVLFCLFLLTCI